MAISSDPGILGSSPPDFSLPGVDGKIHSLHELRSAKALVLVFMCNHCPYVIAVQDRINQLAQEYATRGVKVVAINSNDSLKYPDDSFEKMKERAQEKGYLFSYLQDETQEVARLYGAVCTPEFYAYGRSSSSQRADELADGLVLQYKGRLDDNWKDPSKVTRRDLALALDQILLGKLPDLDQKPSMGCSIKWK